MAKKNVKSDKKTIKNLGEATELELMCKSNGWLVVKQMFIEEIMEMADIMNIDEADLSKLAIDIKGRQLASARLWKLLTRIDTKIKNKNAFEESFNQVKEEQIFIKE